MIVRFLALPILVGLMSGIGGDVRFYRTVFLEESSRDYVRTARAKGGGEARIMMRHVLRNALIPILTQVVLAIPFLFTGSLLLESFFGIPGLGVDHGRCDPGQRLLDPAHDGLHRLAALHRRADR